MNATETRVALEKAREVLSDEHNIVHKAENYFETDHGVIFSRSEGIHPNQLANQTKDWTQIDRVCGAGAFRLVTRDRISINEAFAFKKFEGRFRGIPLTVTDVMTDLVARHEYGELLDLYDEAIAYWSAVEAGVVEPTGHEYRVPA